MYYPHSLMRPVMTKKHMINLNTIFFRYLLNSMSIAKTEHNLCDISCHPSDNSIHIILSVHIKNIVASNLPNTEIHNTWKRDQRLTRGNFMWWTEEMCKATEEGTRQMKLLQRNWYLVRNSWSKYPSDIHIKLIASFCGSLIILVYWDL